MSFILLGNQRSGTSYLLDLLCQHPLVDAINEPFSMHLDFFREDETPWNISDYDEKYLHIMLKPYPATQTFIRDLERWLNFDYPTVRGFKETGLFEKYDWLQFVLGFNQTIILLRDLRAVLYSVLRRNLHQSWWDYQTKLRRFYNCDCADDDLAICAELLKRRTDNLISIAQNHPCLIIRLEDILSQPATQLDRLMAYLRLNTSKNQMSFFLETSSETRDSAYSNFRKKQDVIDKWKAYFNEEATERINRMLYDELLFGGYTV